MFKQLWHRFMTPELPAGFTAIAFHWTVEGALAPPDQTFIHPGILHDEALHRVLDPLIEEHAPRALASNGEVVTEVTMFWHHTNGSWEMEELKSRLYV